MVYSRVGGRINLSILPEDSKNPPISPSNHVTCLIVLHYHLSEGHCGTSLVLSLSENTFGF